MKPNYMLAGRYQIKRPLGEGGMADVYLAHDLILDRDVSVKLLRLDLRDDPATVRRFQREAMAASELVSPHIVSVYDVGEEHGMQYLVMEYVAGMDLKAYLKKHVPLSYPTVIDLMTQILEAVSVAHDHGIIHRDLKPQNVLVGENGQLKISDFGISVISNESSMTQTNTVLGSVHYLSPEQARGGMATRQSDIYSLGIILYELLAGKVPFDGETAVSVALKHSQSQMPSVRDEDPAIAQPLENVILRATAKDPNDRYPSAAAMAADLATALAPERRGEAKFSPAELDEDATKVIPVADVRNAARSLSKDQTGRIQPTEKSSTPIKKRRVKGRPLFWVILAVLLIAGGLAAWLLPQREHVPNVSGMTLTRAERVLKQNQLRAGKQTKKTSETFTAGRVIKSSPAAGQRMRRNAAVALVISSGRPKISVDDYTGSSYKSARKQLLKLGLRVKEVQEFSSDATKGVVIDQDVLPGDAVYKRAFVTLTVSAGPKMAGAAQQVKMADFIGKSQADVQHWAEQHNVAVSFSDELSATVKQGKIIRQAPAKGSLMSEGQTFAAVVSAGKPLRSFHVNLAIPYHQNRKDTKNDVKIYIADRDKNFDSVYQHLQIGEDTTVSLPFTITSGKSGRYKVVSDGKVILTDNHVTGN
ncbi:Stk1 family PASTA domain-containing Ser/Thr kinase [Furfurilactobacillus siliginis]|uniref:non-specific serine/threonine protein kinase n=1 Tax=Furfurilactobacillus siliginis TaxID=348151 RepID=A0A0R2L593_9LACO|nr:Stk1 family PASTA domain-containing Ser/Thr kinase [Furfurilactobacillus siliginis]KRN96894.1 non-specific serine threonine protein kinase [Furfurilactobacillus siliginis]GEK28090.1 protein kinase [Furfurilactobacillus siliginis]